MTLHLSRAEVAALMAPGDYIDITAAAFVALADGRVASPAPMHVPAQDGGFHAKAALLAGEEPVFCLKLNGNFPGNPAKGLPTIQGVIVLSSAEDGRVLAVMDSVEVTLRRTAAATAVAARCLAGPESAVLTLVGCGDQGEAQLRALAAVLPLERVYAVDVDAERAVSLAHRCADLGLSIAPGSLEDCRGSDVVVTCTPSRTAFLRRDQLSPGAFVAAVGADSVEKAELDAQLLGSAGVVTDLTSQCVVMGDLRSALAAGVMTAEDVRAELGDVLRGAKPGRLSTDEVMIFDSTGLGVQDLAAALELYRRATGSSAGNVGRAEETGVGSVGRGTRPRT